MSGNVLIVDDSLTVRMDLAESFEAAGLHAILCGTLAEARAALAAHEIDLAVLDVMLPDGDGVSLLEEIRAGASPDLPVLMLTGETEVKDRIRGMRKGANDYVGKPYDTGHVVARAAELLRMRDGAEPSAEQRTVLVIDDSLTFREALKEALQGAGFRVVTAESGEQGLKLAAARRPAALIVDGVMPGIDGSTVVRRVRLDAALRGLPCLLLTASAQRDAELRALESGADAFVHKGEDLDVVLARFSAMLRSTQTEAARGTSLSSPKRVLAVDDSPTYLHELAGVLRDEGYDVVLAHSGEEALEVLEVQSVDCILLDLMMPGMGGQETCKRIKSSTTLRNIPLIMLTAVENRRALIEGLSTGADDYISKSSELDVLRARIQAQIRRKQFEDENRRIRDQLLRSELEAAEARAARELAAAKSALVEELEYKNRELESFSYSVSHDLRAPLRSIDGFSQALVEDCADQLDETGKNYLQRIRASAQRMGALIDDMLLLARISRTQVEREAVDLSAMAQAVVDELAQHTPERKVTVDIQPGLILQADRGLMRVLLDNLLGNAWKFTARAPAARIELRAEDAEGVPVFSVKDNGAGFDMAHAANLFQPFQRLHNNSDFPGTGIGLATVRRVIDHHGGRIWAKAAVGEGAMISFTVPETRSPPIHEPPQADSAGRRQ
jgi:DNA-binding response OmpR family regulator